MMAMVVRGLETTLAWASGATLALLLTALGAGSAGAQQLPPWALRLETGWVNVHDSPDPGPALVVAGQRRLDRAGTAWLDGALTLAGADESSIGLTLGPEVRLLPRSRLTPVGAVRVGGVMEESEIGWLVEARVGLLVRVSRAVALRGAFAWGAHGDPGATAAGSGPTGLLFGVDWGLGGG